MSYEIIKSIKVKKSETNNEYVAEINSASNNCYPRYFSTYTCFEGKGLSKEEVEKQILLDYFLGNIQKGNNKYHNTVEKVGTWGSKRSNLLENYYQFSLEKDRVFQNYHGDEYFTKLKEINEKYKGIYEEVAETLYKVLNKEIKIKPSYYILCDKEYHQKYVAKLNTKTYRVTYNIQQAKRFIGIAEEYNKKDGYFLAIPVEE